MRLKHFQYCLFILSLFFILSPFALSSQKEKDTAEPGVKKPDTLISDVRITPPSFNPSVNQNTEISYHLRQDAKVTVHVFDPDGRRIRTLIERADRTAGHQKEKWDGKDKNAQTVPDEAYGFTIKAVDNQGHTEIYKPPVSEWKRFDISEIRISEITNTMTYHLPKPCRTRIRIGIENGPLLYAPLDWHPKIAGEIMVHWDGWDKSRTVKIWKLPKSKVVITNMELPENTMITYGNKKTDYIEYCLSETRSQFGIWKQKRNEFTSVTSPAPLLTMLSPRLKISFPMTKQFTPGGVPVLSKKTLVRIEVENRILVSKTRYELIFFIDGDFHSEEPLGISPYNWVWDLSNVKKGEHLLTVNLVSFNDQIGITNKKIKVK